MPHTTALASPSAQAAVAAALATAAALGWLYLRGRIESLEQALAIRAAECGVLRSALAKLEQETEASVEEARVTRTQLNESLNAHHESLSTQREALESQSAALEAARVTHELRLSEHELGRYLSQAALEAKHAEVARLERELVELRRRGQEAALVEGGFDDGGNGTESSSQTEEDREQATRLRRAAVATERARRRTRIAERRSAAARLEQALGIGSDGRISD